MGHPFLATSLSKDPDPIVQDFNETLINVTTTIVQNFEGQSGSAFTH